MARVVGRSVHPPCRSPPRNCRLPVLVQPPDDLRRNSRIPSPSSRNGPKATPRTPDWIRQAEMELALSIPTPAACRPVLGTLDIHDAPDLVVLQSMSFLRSTANCAICWREPPLPRFTVIAKVLPCRLVPLQLIEVVPLGLSALADNQARWSFAVGSASAAGTGRNAFCQRWSRHWMSKSSNAGPKRGRRRSGPPDNVSRTARLFAGVSSDSMSASENSSVPPFLPFSVSHIWSRRNSAGVISWYRAWRRSTAPPSDSPPRSGTFPPVCRSSAGACCNRVRRRPADLHYQGHRSRPDDSEKPLRAVGFILFERERRWFPRSWVTRGAFAQSSL